LEKREEQEEMVKTFEDELKKEKKVRKELEKKFENIRKSDELRVLEGLEDKEEELKKSIKSQEDRIIQEFSSLGKAFKKFKYRVEEREVNKEILEDYIESPLSAIEKDIELKELSWILEKLDEFVWMGKLNLSSKRAGKIKEELRKLKDGSLEGMVEKYRELKDEKEKTIEWMNQMEIKSVKEKLEKDFGKVSKKIEDIEEKISDARIEMKTWEKKIEEEKNKVEKDIAKVVEKKILLKV
jgi:hypothetical protein